MRIEGVFALTAILCSGLLLAAACSGSRPAGKVQTVPFARVSSTLLPSTSEPLVAIRLLFDVGSIDDPEGKEGLAALTAAMIAEGGSKRLTYSQLVDALYPLAATINVRADKEVTVISGKVHRDNLVAYYDLLRQVLLEPRFDVADFERLREDHLNYLVNVLRATDDENLGKEMLGAMMYPGHPYGRPDAGTVEGLKAITIDDVRKFFASHFTRDNCRLGLAGGFDGGFVERVQSDLARLPKGRPERPRLPSPGQPQGIEVRIATKAARACAISIGYPIAVTRADDDFYALMVANSYLGEHRTFSGRLMNKMRAERGLNYGDYSYIENFIQEGGSTFPLPNIPRRQQFFSIWIRPVAPQNVHFAVRQALRELDALVRDGMSEANFEATRDFLLNYSRLWAQGVSRRLGYAMDGEFYRKGSLVDEVQKRLPSLTLAEVNAAIRKHLRTGSAYVAVVADEEGAGELARALESNAPSPIRYTTETKPDVLAEDKLISVFPLVVNAAKLRIIRASELFEK